MRSGHTTSLAGSVTAKDEVRDERGGIATIDPTMRNSDKAVFWWCRQGIALSIKDGDRSAARGRRAIVLARAKRGSYVASGA